MAKDQHDEVMMELVPETYNQPYELVIITITILMGGCTSKEVTVVVRRSRESDSLGKSQSKAAPLH